MSPPPLPANAEPPVSSVSSADSLDCGLASEVEAMGRNLASVRDSLPRLNTLRRAHALLRLAGLNEQMRALLGELESGSAPAELAP